MRSPGPQSPKLLSRDHTIVERPFLEFRPFGIAEGGDKIRDLTGFSVATMVEYLERSAVVQIHGVEQGIQAVQELCELLNERIRHRAYQCLSCME